MAFKISDYGSGALGTVTTVSGTLNSSARVTAVTATSITINTSTQTTGTATFTVGAKVMIHVSATTSSSYKTYLGRYMLANIVSVNNGVLVLDANPTTCIPTANLSQYYVQAIAVAEFANLTLSSGTTVSPVAYSVTNYHGGIVAIMCSGTLTFSGGHISLTDRGIPVANKTLRPTLTNYDVEADTTDYAGYENSGTQTYFLLNAGDGACFIAAKKMVCSTSSRIGNVSTRGYQFYRGNSTSVTYNETAPSGVTNVGGSTILIAAETITSFTPYMISKYRAKASTAGQGICRCYIASETKLRNDEGLYAYDVISTPGRIKDMNIKNFGNGSFGDITNITTQMNNYATVTAISGVKVTYKNATTTGLAQITTGALVMIHWNHKGSSYVTDAGRFWLANVLSNTGTVLTLDSAPPSISVSNYACQVVSIPQATNFTLSGTNSATPAFDGAQGGIFAIAVKNTANISDGKIDVREKGGGKAYARAGLAVIGNAQDANKLPIGQGHGSVFILAQNLTMNTNTRLGHTSTGAGAFKYKYSSASGAGVDDPLSNYAPGYGSNGSGAVKYRPQGAHLVIVADKITGFALSAICTGGYNLYAGQGGGSDSSHAPYNCGAYIKGSVGAVYAGSSGWAFIYCNQAVNQNNSYILYTY